jgi:hypothetical protein
MQQQPNLDLSPQVVTLLNKDRRIAELMKKHPENLAVLNAFMIATQMNREVVKVVDAKSTGISFHVKSLKNQNTKRALIEPASAPAYNVMSLREDLGYDIPTDGLGLPAAQERLVAPSCTPRG